MQVVNVYSYGVYDVVCVSFGICVCVCVCVCVCARACVRACVRVRACVHACVRACIHACPSTTLLILPGGELCPEVHSTQQQLKHLKYQHYQVWFTV